MERQATKSWTIGILPYIEEQALHDIYNFELANDCPSSDPECAISNKRVRETQLAIHACPSDTLLDQLGRPASGRGSGEFWARGSYRGNAGRSNGNGQWWDAQQNVSSMPRGWKGPLTTSCGPEELWEKPGSVSSFCSGTGSVKDPVKMRQVEDGTSKTLLIGEQTTQDSGDRALSRRTFWAYTYTSYNKSEVVPETFSMFSDYERCAEIGYDENICKRMWGTAHVNGIILFAHADGSVKGYPPDIDMQAFAAAASIAGSEVVAF